jgi:hypothetical protein
MSNGSGKPSSGGTIWESQRRTFRLSPHLYRWDSTASMSYTNLAHLPFAIGSLTVQQPAD